MDSASGAGASDPNEGEGPSSAPAAGAGAGAGTASGEGGSTAAAPPLQPPSRYESQKRRDWNTFLQYLKNHKPPLTLARCSGAHVIEFLKYLDQFGKTKVHVTGCPYFGHPNPPAPCACPLKQAWGSLDALIGRLRAAYEENGGRPESNPFGARAVRIFLREVRESQAKARGIPYEKKKRKRPTTVAAAVVVEENESTMAEATSTSQVGDGGGGGGGTAVPSVSSTAASTTTTV
ncbi:unnamed protein product [Camellia sinensis]